MHFVMFVPVLVKFLANVVGRNKKFFSWDKKEQTFIITDEALKGMLHPLKLKIIQTKTTTLISDKSDTRMLLNSLN